MDPKMCLLDLIAKIYEDDPDKDRIEELVEAYEEWRKKQGFEPKFDTIDFAANEAFKFYNVGKTGEISGDLLFGSAKLHIAMRLDGCPYCGRMQLDETLEESSFSDGFAFKVSECANCHGKFETKYAPCGLIVLDDSDSWAEVPFHPRKLVKVHVEGGVVQDVEIPSDDITVEVHDYDGDSEEEHSVSDWKSKGSTED